MLQYSVYSVISPEGCASILWKSADKKEAAADAMGLTADRLQSLKLVDAVLPEPLGGAHRDHEAMAATVKAAVMHHLDALSQFSTPGLLAHRAQRLASFGQFSEGRA
jgi:acetyl-CoA carboxylase carboxyl transferase subunit alpha